MLLPLLLTLFGSAGEEEPTEDYDAIAFSLKGGSRIRSYLAAEPRLKFKLTGKPG